MTNPKVSIIILNRNGTQDPTPHPNPAHPCAQPQACTHPPGPHHTSTAPPHDDRGQATPPADGSAVCFESDIRSSGPGEIQGYAAGSDVRMRKAIGCAAIKRNCLSVAVDVGSNLFIIQPEV